MADGDNKYFEDVTGQSMFQPGIPNTTSSCEETFTNIQKTAPEYIFDGKDYSSLREELLEKCNPDKNFSGDNYDCEKYKNGLLFVKKIKEADNEEQLNIIRKEAEYVLGIRINTKNLYLDLKRISDPSKCKYDEFKLQLNDLHDKVRRNGFNYDRLFEIKRELAPITEKIKTLIEKEIAEREREEELQERKRKEAEEKQKIDEFYKRLKKIKNEYNSKKELKIIEDANIKEGDIERLNALNKKLEFRQDAIRVFFMFLIFMILSFTPFILDIFLN